MKRFALHLLSQLLLHMLLTSLRSFLLFAGVASVTLAATPRPTPTSVPACHVHRPECPTCAPVCSNTVLYATTKFTMTNDPTPTTIPGHPRAVPGDSVVHHRQTTPSHT